MTTVLSGRQQQLVHSFNEKVRQGRLPIENASCLCGSRDAAVISRSDRYGLWSPVLICRHCGLIYASPRLTIDGYRQFYESDEYRRIYEGDENFLEMAEARFDRSYGRHIFDVVYPAMTARGLATVVEVGCAAGWNLIHFAEQGCQVSGYDYSQSLVTIGRLRGLDIRNGSIDEIQGTYDVIILNHIVEHFSFPVESLRKLRKHIRTNGLVYIGVPNMDHFSLGELQNAHTYYFSPRTFSHYMAVAGLKLLRFGPAEEIHMYGLFEPSDSRLSTGLTGAEYFVMRRTISRAKARERVARLLALIALKKPARTLYRLLIGRFGRRRGS